MADACSTNSSDHSSCSDSSEPVDRRPAGPSPVSKIFEVEHVGNELDEMIENGIEYVRRLRALRNTRTLIYRLPPEILSNIFEFASQCWKIFGPSGWLALTHVCRYWRFIALESPKLWRNISFACVGLTEEMLRRSKSAPIVIKARSLSPSTAAIRAVSLALEHLGRTRVLHLSFLGFPEARITRTLRAPAPCLESLHLSEINPSGLCTLPKSPFDGQTPRLRHLELSHCRFSWDAPLFTSSNLDYLDIRYPAVRPTMAQILTLLDHMPLLHTLILLNATPIIPNAVTFGHVDHTVNLPKLLSLNFDGPVSHCVYLLNHLSYPSASSLRLRCTGVLAMDGDGIFSVVVSKGGWGQDGKSMRSLFVRCDRNSIRFRCFTTGAHYPDDDLGATAQMDLQFESNGADISDQRAVVGAFKALPLSSLQILHTDDLDLDEHGWFDAFHNLTELRTVSFKNTHATGLLNALNMNVVDAPGPGHLLFPQLRIFMLVDVCFECEDPSSAGSSCLLQACMDRRRRCKAAIQELRLEDCTGLGRDDLAALKKLVDLVVHYETETEEEE